MIEMLTVSLVALTASWPEPRRPPVPLLTPTTTACLCSSRFPSMSTGFDEALRVLSPSVRRAVDGRLKKRRACKPRFAMPEDGREVEKELAFKHGAIECAIIALANRPGVEREAAAYAEHAILYYEWEGSSDGPIAEAGFAEDYLESHSRTALAPYLLVFLLHRYRCAVPQRPTSWQTFLKAHWGAIAGADFFTTDVWTWRGLVTYYTVFVIDLASRRVQILGSTPHPEALFMQQIVRTLTIAESDAVPVPNVLICDRDRKRAA
jgi:hypothetical protein